MKRTLIFTINEEEQLALLEDMLGGEEDDSPEEQHSRKRNGSLLKEELRLGIEAKIKQAEEVQKTITEEDSTLFLRLIGLGFNGIEETEQGIFLLEPFLNYIGASGLDIKKDKEKLSYLITSVARKENFKGYWRGHKFPADFAGLVKETRKWLADRLGHLIEGGKRVCREAQDYDESTLLQWKEQFYYQTPPMKCSV